MVSCYVKMQQFIRISRYRTNPRVAGRHFLGSREDLGMLKSARATRPRPEHVVQGMTKPFDKQKEEDSIANRIKASGNRHHGVCTLSYLYQVLRSHRGMSMERNNKMFVRRLKRDGFQLGSVPGSHDKFRKAQITEIVPNPMKDLPIGTSRSIARQVEWLKEEDR